MKIFLLKHTVTSWIFYRFFGLHPVYIRNASRKFVSPPRLAGNLFCHIWHSLKKYRRFHCFGCKFVFAFVKKRVLKLYNTFLHTKNKKFLRIARILEKSIEKKCQNYRKLFKIPSHTFTHTQKIVLIFCTFQNWQEKK